PGIRAARNIALDLGQKSQFRDLEQAIEAFAISNDNDYPDSDEDAREFVTTGAHKLTEALVGRDLHGFDPKSSWDATLDEPEDDIYISKTAVQDYVDRKGLLVNTDKIKAYDMAQFYSYAKLQATNNTPYPGLYNYNGDITDERHK